MVTHTGLVISVELAQRLKHSGVVWTPSSGDRFVVPDHDLEDLVFAVSDMVVEVVDLPTGRIFAFNGTTEWALDSVGQDEVLWMPSEDQLRSMLGEAFVALERTPGGFIVRIEREGAEDRHIDISAESAYARAVLALTGS